MVVKHWPRVQHEDQDLISLAQILRVSNSTSPMDDESKLVWSVISCLGNAIRCIYVVIITTIRLPIRCRISRTAIESRPVGVERHRLKVESKSKLTVVVGAA